MITRSITTSILEPNEYKRTRKGRWNKDRHKVFAISGCESEAFGMSFRCSEPMIQKHLSFTVLWFSVTFVLSHQLHKIQTALENCTSKVQTAINNRLTFIEKPINVLLNGNIGALSTDSPNCNQWKQRTNVWTSHYVPYLLASWRLCPCHAVQVSAALLSVQSQSRLTVNHRTCWKPQPEYRI